MITKRGRGNNKKLRNGMMKNTTNIKRNPIFYALKTLYVPYQITAVKIGDFPFCTTIF